MKRALVYKEFYDGKQNKDFELLQRCPNMGTLKLYLQKVSPLFPLYEYGKFNVLELAEIIKYIYQFETGDEYSILTSGTIVDDMLCKAYNPHLYFIIGNIKSLKSFLNDNGKFYNSSGLHDKIYLNGPRRNITYLDLDQDSNNSLGIECLGGSTFDEKNKINYFDDYSRSYKTFGTSKDKQIFSSNIMANINVNSNPHCGIKNVIDFNTTSKVANVLISMAIYKRNNGISDFTEDDYNYIFNILYGSRVPIKKDIEKDFKKELVYVL